GAKREYAVLTQKFSGADGQVAKLHCVQVDDKFKPIAGSEFELDAHLVLLAMGFVHPVHEGMLKTLGVDLEPRGNVCDNNADDHTAKDHVSTALHRLVYQCLQRAAAAMRQGSRSTDASKTNCRCRDLTAG